MGSQDDELVRTFGWAPEGKVMKEKRKVVLLRKHIENAGKETQFRTKVDRFTGGVIKTGLFDSTPIWSGENNAHVTINIKIDDCKDWEAGLMLLLLKDLWASDLPLGGEKNIGRGLLKGETVKICFNGNDYIINEDKNLLTIDGDKHELENLVKAFIEKCAYKGA